MLCPACKREIPYRKVLLSPCPLWIRCPSCRAKLTGDKTMFRIASVVGLVALVAALTVLFWIRSNLEGLGWQVLAYALFAVVLATLLGLPTTAAAMRSAKYELKSKR